MSNDGVSLFLAMLTVLCLVFVASCAVVAVLSRARGLGPTMVDLRESVTDASLSFAFAVAAVCTMGSLYMSEVRHFPPCDLCWYQRIAMYPLVVLLGIAAVRRDRGIWRYVLPITVIGAGISTYHYLHERFPDSVATACSMDVSCATLWIWEFHFLSIPAMAWVGFVTIATLMLIARRGERRDSDADRVLGGDADPVPDRSTPSGDDVGTTDQEVPA